MLCTAIRIGVVLGLGVGERVWLTHWPAGLDVCFRPTADMIESVIDYQGLTISRENYVRSKVARATRMDVRIVGVTYSSPDRRDPAYCPWC